MVTLDAVKLAMRVVTTEFDSEITDLINSAKQDLGIAGVEIPTTDEPIVNRAVITYCKAHFGEPDEYDRLKRAYDEQKAQLSTATGFTVWSE